MSDRTKRREPEAHVEVVWLVVDRKTGRMKFCCVNRAMARQIAGRSERVVRAIATPTKRAGGGA